MLTCGLSPERSLLAEALSALHQGDDHDYGMSRARLLLKLHNYDEEHTKDDNRQTTPVTFV